MAGTKNLELRGKTWWVIKIVTPSLRPIIGKAFQRRSLRTGDLHEALRLRPYVLAEFAREIEEAKAQRTATDDPVAARALAWKRLLADGKEDTGQPIEAELKAALLAEETLELQAEFGPRAVPRFQRIVATETATPLDHYIDRHQAETDVIPKTKAEQKMALRRLIAWRPSASIATFDRKAAGEYISHGMTFTASNVTKNKHISCLSSYWRWMLRRGLVTENPWRDQFLPAKAKSNTEADGKERAFTTSEMQALLSGKPDAALRDMILISALSGMRREEIANLRVRDCDGGVFDIKQAKTDAGVRQVPIHSALHELVARRCAGKRPDAFLIHEIGPAPKPGAMRGRGAKITQRFKTYREGVGVAENIDGRRRSIVNFHSLRRWFVTQAEQAGQPPHVIEAVVGHKRQGMSLGVYSAGPSLDQRRQCVESVRLPEQRNPGP